MSFHSRYDNYFVSTCKGLGGRGLCNMRDGQIRDKDANIFAYAYIPPILQVVKDTIEPIHKISSKVLNRVTILTGQVPALMRMYMC